MRNGVNLCTIEMCVVVPLNVVANFDPAAKSDEKGFSATVDQTFFKKIVANGFGGMWIDLFSGGFDNAMSKNAAIQLDYFYRPAAVRTNDKHFFYIDTSVKLNKK